MGEIGGIGEMGVIGDIGGIGEMGEMGMNRRKCIFGCVDNVKGREIAAEMMAWLEPLYDVECVWHDGSRFEYPALKRVDEFCRESGRPCLYLHTKGAYNKPVLSPRVRRMWKGEFGDARRAEMYFRAVEGNEPVVACPFSGPTRFTRYNGFVVNAAAMAAVGFHWTEDRLWYEIMWKHEGMTDVRAMMYWGTLEMSHIILERYYSR